jgi:hypothetical protein
MVELVKSLMSKITQMFLKAIDSDNLELTKHMKLIFDPEMNFYKENSPVARNYVRVSG